MIPGFSSRWCYGLGFHSVGHFRLHRKVKRNWGFPFHMNTEYFQQLFNGAASATEKLLHELYFWKLNVTHFNLPISSKEIAIQKCIKRKCSGHMILLTEIDRIKNE